MTTLLVLVIFVALIFEFANGWCDSANAVATIISTRVLPPYTAIILAAILNFIGALISTKVARTIGGGLVDPRMITHPILLATLASAAGWVIFCALRGLPVSGSHSLIGGLVGASAAVFGTQILNWSGLKLVLCALILSPIAGFIGGYILLVIFYWTASRMSPSTVRRTFSILQVCSSGFVAFTHGTNDAQKVMGVITLALFASGLIPSITVPLWVMILCAVVMGLGTALGGWKVIKTVGMKLSHIRPIEGCAAETAAGLILSFAAHLGAPVSTTHTTTGAIIGVGSAYRIKSVKWSIGAKIVFAWILTLPTCAIISAILSILLTMLFKTLSAH